VTDISETNNNVQVEMANLKKAYTELKQQHKELLISHNLLENHYSNSPASQLSIDKAGVIISANAKLLLKLKVDKKFVINKPFFIFIHQQDREHFFALLKKIFLGELIENEIFRMINKSGEINFVKLHGKVNKTLDVCQFILIECSQKDALLSAKKQIEPLQEAIFNLSPIGISIRGASGTLISSNKKWQEIFNFSDDTLVGYQLERSQLKFDENDDYLKDHMVSIRNVYSHGGSYFMPRVKLPKRMGANADWISQHFIAVMDTRGNVDKVIIYTMDITEFTQYEGEIENRERRYKHFVQAMTEGIAIHDNGKILEVNDNLEKMLDFSRNDAIGKSIFEFIPSEFVEKTMLNITSKEDIIYDSFLLNSDSTRVPVEIITKPFVYNGRNVRVAVIRNLTERKNHIKKIHQQQKLDALALIGRGIAHDINNALMIVMSNISLMLMDKNLSSDITNYANNAKQGVKRGEFLASQLLAFTHGNNPNMLVGDIQRILRESTEFVLSGSNILPVFEIEDNLPIMQFDTEQMTQTFSNIFLNARQSMSKGGILLIKVEKILNRSMTKIIRNIQPAPISNIRSEGSYLSISITDEGCGIEMDKIVKIFEPFYSTRKVGTGLGLSIVKSVIEQHNGFISVDSKVGFGTQFIIYLPIVSTLTTNKGPEKLTPVWGSGSILLMDDEQVIRESLTMLLNQIGYKVEAVSNGKEAVSRYIQRHNAGNPFDLAILDITIPGGKGARYSAINILLHDPNAKLIVASGYSQSELIVDFKHFGFKERIVKPFDIIELSHKLAKILDD